MNPREACIWKAVQGSHRVEGDPWGQGDLLAGDGEEEVEGKSRRDRDFHEDPPAQPPRQQWGHGWHDLRHQHWCNVAPWPRPNAWPYAWPEQFSRLRLWLHKRMLGMRGCLQGRVRSTGWLRVRIEFGLGVFGGVPWKLHWLGRKGSCLLLLDCGGRDYCSWGQRSRSEDDDGPPLGGLLGDGCHG
ncbi:uncharacterized protein [Physcomitrium patens]|uniref:Uncharacterized protein n=1 Tax=Physcomitrium patens TaxID=3218 RepID=A0A7I3ZWN7_PHYPA